MLLQLYSVQNFAKLLGYLPLKPEQEQSIIDGESAGSVLSALDPVLTERSIIDCFRLGKYRDDQNLLVPQPGM